MTSTFATGARRGIALATRISLAMTIIAFAKLVLVPSVTWLLRGRRLRAVPGQPVAEAPASAAGRLREVAP